VYLPWRTAFPATLPPVVVEPLPTAPVSSGVICTELQWWLFVPRSGEQNAIIWYDRDSGEPTLVCESTVPAADVGDGTVRIELDEWTRDPGVGTVTRAPIAIVGDVTDIGARFQAMTVGDHTTRTGEPEFEANWVGGSPCRIVDDGRYETVGERRYRTAGGCPGSRGS